MKPFSLSPKQIASLATEAVLETEKAKRKGGGAHRHATRILARKIDDLLKWPPTPLGLLAETLDGAAAALTMRILGGFVEDAWDRLQERRNQKRPVKK